jgi:hypothetical protein
MADAAVEILKIGGNAGIRADDPDQRILQAHVHQAVIHKAAAGSTRFRDVKWFLNIQRRRQPGPTHRAARDGPKSVVTKPASSSGCVCVSPMRATEGRT